MKIDNDPNIHNSRNGFAIILAWPQTFCKQAGGWYDPFLMWLGISKNHYYHTGHAAVVLVNGFNGCSHYFDFGRYHSPFGYGRVRSDATDPELKMIINAEILNGNINNLGSILMELSNRKACHGEGNLYASVLPIDFGEAINKAKALQNQSPITYGPFVWKGTNCSRFVNDVLKAGNPSFLTWLKLMFPWTLIPTPMGNVKAGGKRYKIPGLKPGIPRSQFYLDTVLPNPIKHPSIPSQSIWLGGEGAGSWFHISRMAELFIVRRYSPSGDIEFSGVYEATGRNYFFPQSVYSLDYLSHYQKITIKQAGKLIVLKPIPNSPFHKFEYDGIKFLLDKMQLISN